MAKTLSPIESFLAPLAKLAAKNPEIEGEVIWANGTDWDAQDDDAEMLDAEEIAFYAEGLLVEGFHLHWQVLAETEQPKTPVHARLFFWQSGGAENPAPEAPAPEEGLTVVASGTWIG
jgi:hypothetical protein